MTNPMIPTEEDKQLRIEIARKVYPKPTPIEIMICGTPEVVIDEIYSEAPIVYEFARYITADRKRVALEAKIDELNNVRDMNLSVITHNRIIDRIAELKAQQEKTNDQPR